MSEEMIKEKKPLCIICFRGFRIKTYCRFSYLDNAYTCKNGHLYKRVYFRVCRRCNINFYTVSYSGRVCGNCYKITTGQLNLKDCKAHWMKKGLTYVANEGLQRK